MKKYPILILPTIVITFDLLFRYTFNVSEDYIFIYYFTVSYIAFILLSLSYSYYNNLIRYITFTHFVILFIFLSIDLIGALNARGIGHVGDWWGYYMLKTTSFVYPNIVLFIIISLMLLFNKVSRENKTYRFLVGFILFMSISFGVFYYYNVNYSFKLDFPY